MIADTLDRVMHYARAVDPRYRYRSSVTGKWVTRAFALLHPRETQRERIK